MLKLYGLIIVTFDEERERIDVPVTDDQSGNTLQKQWALIVDLMKRSMLVEEVIAVHRSLLQGIELDERLISHGQRREFVKTYQEKYGEFIDGYAGDYDLFDFVAGKIGKDATKALIVNVFETINPSQAFIDILSETAGFLWALQGEFTDYISTLSLVEMHHYFSIALNHLDPDDTRYRRTLVSQDVARIEQHWSIANLDDDFEKFLCDPQETILYSKYSDIIHPFSKPTEVCKDVEYGNIYIILEAILQQLTQGMGLVCPFWVHKPHTCCGRENRAFLEKVWGCTSHNSCCGVWERLGCLNKKAVAHFKRIHRKALGAKA
jgi:hypothetical protein